MEHRIDVGNHKPIHSAPYRPGPGLREEISAEIRKWLDLGVIRHAKATAWSAPALGVRKPDGSLRVVVDYRKLNDTTEADAYPMANIGDLLSSLYGAKFFSSLDLNQGYLQIKMSEDSIAKTAFVT